MKFTQKNIQGVLNKIHTFFSMIHTLRKQGALTFI